MVRKEQNKWRELASYFETRSREICDDHNCTEDKHFCESNAYITERGDLIDICVSDAFQGWNQDDIDEHGDFVVIPLPWDGDGKKLMAAVENELSE